MKQKMACGHIKIFSGTGLSSSAALAACRLVGEQAKEATAHTLTFRDPGFSPRQRARLHEFASDQGLDYAFVPQGLRLQNFRLLATDMDSTLIDIECIDEMARLAGTFEQVTALTSAAVQGEEKDYVASLRARTMMLKGLKSSQLHGLLREKVRLSPGAGTLLDAMYCRGIRSIIVSGGFSFVARYLQQHLPISDVFAHELETRGETLTGRIVGPAITSNAKEQIVTRYCETAGINNSQVIAIGDGANDVDMLSGAGLAVGFRPKKVLREMCSVVLNASGLDAVLLALDEEPLFRAYQEKGLS